MKYCFIVQISTIFFLSFLLNHSSRSQAKTETLSSTILKLDSAFWDGYNSCDSSKFRSYFSNDIEFYHDKGGITNGLENLSSSFYKNLCSGNFRLRREAVKGSVKVFPLMKDEEIYGAVISGEHVFYNREIGKPERLDGLAKFTHIWLLKNNVWKMTRVISYDHGPATPERLKK